MNNNYFQLDSKVVTGVNVYFQTNYLTNLLEYCRRTAFITIICVGNLNCNVNDFFEAMGNYAALSGPAIYYKNSEQAIQDGLEAYEPSLYNCNQFINVIIDLHFFVSFLLPFLKVNQKITIFTKKK